MIKKCKSGWTIYSVGGERVVTVKSARVALEILGAITALATLRAALRG